MTPAEFLRYMWPDKGPYCIAYDFTASDKKVYVTQKVFEGVAAAALYCKNNPNRNLWFATHSLKKHEVIEERHAKDGSIKQTKRVRTHGNMKASRLFFFDLDVSGVDDEKHYATRKGAIEDLDRFRQIIGLPVPMLVASGGGVHVYWRMHDDMTTEDWKPYASKLKALAAHHGLRVDPSRVDDQSSVLRIVGTWNRKPKRDPRMVELRTPLRSYPNAIILKAIDDAVISAGVTLHVPKAKLTDDEFGSNTQMPVDFGPPVKLRELAETCPQMLRIMKVRGNVSEPEWYAALQVMRHVHKGEHHAHTMSDGYPNYDPDQVDRKLAQLEEKDVGPTSCAKLSSVCGAQYCFGCKFEDQWHGTSKGPISFARMQATAEPPKVEPPPGVTDQAFTLPNPPLPYRRKPDGSCVTMEITTKDGNVAAIPILYYDLYPERRIVNKGEQSEYIDWCVKRPKDVEPHRFRLEASALYDTRTFASQIAGHGVYMEHDNIKHVMAYMSAYIRELQKQIEAEKQHPHLGWTDDKQAFVMPDKTIRVDGKVTQAHLSDNAERAGQHIHKRGTLEQQVELMRFFDHPAYIPNQFFMACSLAAPLFGMTDKHGVIVNASGVPGAAKSTSLYTAASFWGDPELYPINGTNTGATEKARFELASVLATLPVMVDEITKMDNRQASDLALGITQPNHRIRLERSGKIKKTEGGHKATIVMTTANTSLHGILSQENTAGSAGSMRVVEIMFYKKHIHRKADADDFIALLKENYGHLGEVFMHYVVNNVKTVHQMVRDKMREIDTLGRFDGSERFWSATFAAALVSIKIAVELGLLRWNVSAIQNWLIHELLPQMRGVIVEEYQSPVGIIADFLEHINGKILLLNSGFQGKVNTIFEPHGELAGRYDHAEQRMYIAVKALKDYCQRVGANHREILETLHQPTTVDDKGRRMRIVTNKMIKKVLGAGTDHAKAQSWCFVLNMEHPEVSGLAPQEKPQVISTPGVIKTTPPRANLKLVKDE